jgi:hypothetical protein
MSQYHIALMILLIILPAWASFLLGMRLGRAREAERVLSSKRTRVTIPLPDDGSPYRKILELPSDALSKNVAPEYAIELQLHLAAADLAIGNMHPDDFRKKCDELRLARLALTELRKHVP